MIFLLNFIWFGEIQRTVPVWLSVNLRQHGSYMLRGGRWRGWRFWRLHALSLGLFHAEVQGAILIHLNFRLLQMKIKGLTEVKLSKDSSFQTWLFSSTCWRCSEDVKELINAPLLCLSYVTLFLEKLSAVKLCLCTLVQGSTGLVLRVSGLSQQRVERLRMAVAAMWAASASWL